MRTSIRMSLVAAVAAMTLLFAAPAMAQQADQRGLVNVAIGDVTVQLPVAIAANICDVNVNVLAGQLRTGDAECEADAESGAVLPGVGDGDNGDTTQEGLVNVAVGDVTLQLPVAVAANVCDVNLNVLARQLRTGDAECEAIAESDAEAA